MMLSAYRRMRCTKEWNHRALYYNVFLWVIQSVRPKKNVAVGGEGYDAVFVLHTKEE